MHSVPPADPPPPEQTPGAHLLLVEGVAGAGGKGGLCQLAAPRLERHAQRVAVLAHLSGRGGGGGGAEKGGLTVQRLPVWAHPLATRLDPYARQAWRQQRRQRRPPAVAGAAEASPARVEPCWHTFE